MRTRACACLDIGRAWLLLFRAVPTSFSDRELISGSLLNREDLDGITIGFFRQRCEYATSDGREDGRNGELEGIWVGPDIFGAITTI